MYSWEQGQRFEAVDAMDIVKEHLDSMRARKAQRELAEEVLARYDREKAERDRGALQNKARAAGTPRQIMK